MKIKIIGLFNNRAEMEHQKERIKKLLLDIGVFTRVKAYEDLITNEFQFDCETDQTNDKGIRVS